MSGIQGAIKFWQEFNISEFQVIHGKIILYEVLSGLFSP